MLKTCPFKNNCKGNSHSSKPQITWLQVSRQNAGDASMRTAEIIQIWWDELFRHQTYSANRFFFSYFSFFLFWVELQTKLTQLPAFEHTLIQDHHITSIYFAYVYEANATAFVCDNFVCVRACAFVVPSEAADGSRRWRRQWRHR